MPFYHSYDIIDLLESPDSEGRRLLRLIDEHGGRSAYVSAKDFSSFATLMASFTDLVQVRNQSARDNGEPLYAPELHISSHGCKEGILWKDGSLIDWETLRVHLIEFASKLNCIYSPERNWPWAETASCIWLSLSCCYAAYASNGLFRPECYACAVLIGPTTEIGFEDCSEVYYRLLKFRMSQASLSDGSGSIALRRIVQEVQPRGPGGDAPFFVGIPPYTPNPNFRPPPGYHPNDPIFFAALGAAPGIEAKNAVGEPMKKNVQFKTAPEHFSAIATGLTVTGPTPDGLFHLSFDRFTTIPERHEFEVQEVTHEGQQVVRLSNHETAFAQPYREVIVTISFSAEGFLASFGPLADQLAKLAADLKQNAAQQSGRDE